LKRRKQYWGPKWKKKQKKTMKTMKMMKKGGWFDPNASRAVFVFQLLSSRVSGICFSFLVWG
jgi:hypothetical protein